MNDLHNAVTPCWNLRFGNVSFAKGGLLGRKAGSEAGKGEGEGQDD